MNMKLLPVVTRPYIYHGFSTWKEFWEEKFIDKENLFLSVNMKNGGRRNVRKHKDIKGSDKYVTLDISLKFDSLDKMKIGKIRKGVDYLFEFQDQRKVTQIQKGKVCHWKCQ